jgi:hypothetical protein
LDDSIGLEIAGAGASKNTLSKTHTILHYQTRDYIPENALRAGVTAVVGDALLAYDPDHETTHSDPPC